MRVIEIYRQSRRLPGSWRLGLPASLRGGSDGTCLMQDKKNPFTPEREMDKVIFGVWPGKLALLHCHRQNQPVNLNIFERVPPIINLWVGSGTPQAPNNDRYWPITLSMLLSDVSDPNTSLLNALGS